MKRFAKVQSNEIEKSIAKQNYSVMVNNHHAIRSKQNSACSSLHMCPFTRYRWTRPRHHLREGTMPRFIGARHPRSVVIGNDFRDRARMRWGEKSVSKSQAPVRRGFRGSERSGLRSYGFWRKSRAIRQSHEIDRRTNLGREHQKRRKTHRTTTALAFSNDLSDRPAALSWITMAAGGSLLDSANGHGDLRRPRQRGTITSTRPCFRKSGQRSLLPQRSMIRNDSI
jgi:hypothetical protein